MWRSVNAVDTLPIAALCQVAQGLECGVWHDDMTWFDLPNGIEQRLCAISMDSLVSIGLFVSKWSDVACQERLRLEQSSESKLF